jgi:hypothetical protein
MDTQSLARRFKIARPKWSLKTSFWSAVVVLAIVSLTIVVLFKKSIWIELEIVTGVLSLFMFAYFFFVLYHGVRFDRKENYTVLWRSRLSKWIDATSGMDTGGFFTQAGKATRL